MWFWRSAMSPTETIWICAKCGRKYNKAQYEALRTRFNKGFARILWPICNADKCQSIEFQAKAESTK